MEKELKLKDENYFQISGWMINKLGLKGNTLMIYAIIYGFSQDGESYFSGSRKYLCDFIGATKRTIDASLEELIEKEYIIKYSETRNNITFNSYKANLNVLNCPTGAKIALGSENIAPNNIEYNIDINTNNINTKKENKKENVDYSGMETINPKIANELVEGSGVLRIFNWWNAKNIIKHSKLNETRIKAIKNKLKQYSAEEIEVAIDHYATVLKDDSYYWNYTWSLEDFLNRKNGFTTFLKEGSNWVNYQKQKNDSPYTSKKEVSKETAYPELKKNYW